MIGLEGFNMALTLSVAMRESQAKGSIPVA